MLGTEVMDISSELDQIANAFSSDNTEELMKLTGQSSGESQKTGLPRLSINYDVETDDGAALTRGDWKIYMGGRFLYASEVILRPLLRMYEYSVWDPEENDGRGGFSSKSVQKPSFAGAFPDTSGGNKCGRLTRDEEDSLNKDDPEENALYLNSRAVICNQVIYGRISGDFTDANGESVRVDNEPLVCYFKKSGFKPMSDFIAGLSSQKKLMAHCEIRMQTSKNKKGSVTYWTPLPTLHGTTEITDDDKELFGMFRETIEAHNKYVMNAYREAQKLIANDDDVDLAADFNDADAA